jgi:MoxR-like ATPase
LDIEKLSLLYQNIKNELGKVIVGQNHIVDHLLISIFANGHTLLVGVPGVAKTLLVKSIATTLGCDFKRIQFTPDLMPGDILGSEVLEEDKTAGSKAFRFIKGPVFANIILADEINRTPPKTQAALLEAMQERQVTVAGNRFDLPRPFFVLATQNPIEQEGTYPLPEAQLDRFMCYLTIEYPEKDEEVEIVNRTVVQKLPDITAVTSAEELMQVQQFISDLPIAENIVRYAVDLVQQTRPEFAPDDMKRFIRWGAGPRASQFLVSGARVWAALNGKLSPDIADVNFVSEAVLKHRILLNFNAEAENFEARQLIQKILG